MNGTGAFVLANLTLIIVLLPYKRIFAFLPLLLYYTLVIIAIDYFTFQYLVNAAIDLLRSGIIQDKGDIIRLIQIEYFVNNMKLLGNGFGTLLHFDYNEVPDRASQHARFPYASEVVFLNFVHGGGIFVGVILLFFSRNMLFCIFYLLSGQSRLDAFLGFSCSLVLIGSISNPFLLSPISILLLAISYDSYSKIKHQQQAARSGYRNNRSYG